MEKSVSVHQRTGGIGNTLHFDRYSVSGDRSHSEVFYWICTRVSRSTSACQCLQHPLRMFFLHEIKQVVEHNEAPCQMSLQVFTCILQNRLQCAR